MLPIKLIGKFTSTTTTTPHFSRRRSHKDENCLRRRSHNERFRSTFEYRGALKVSYGVFLADMSGENKLSNAFYFRPAAINKRLCKSRNNDDYRNVAGKFENNNNIHTEEKGKSEKLNLLQKIWPELLCACTYIKPRYRISSTFPLFVGICVQRPQNFYPPRLACLY